MNALLTYTAGVLSGVVITVLGVKHVLTYRPRR